MPSGSLKDELSALITQLSRTHAAPLFPPHMTLLGELEGGERELVAKTRQLAGQLSPFTVHLTTVDFLDQYFRCLFLRGEETPALVEANRQARLLFQREQDPPFMPHLSLLYGDFDAAFKQKIIAAIGREFDRSFTAGELHLYSTTGETKDWRRVGTFALQG
jgi:2'-5' RNA ligase